MTDSVTVVIINVEIPVKILLEKKEVKFDDRYISGDQQTLHGES